jgi:hypothetical protein
MASFEGPGQLRGWTSAVVVALLSYCAGFTALSASNDLAHAFLGWELKSALYRYVFPWVPVLGTMMWISRRGTDPSKGQP